MLRNIYLHGALGDRFEPEYRLDVNSVGEALHALCTQLDGFEAYFSKHYYEIVRGDAFIDVASAEHQCLGLGALSEIHLIPCAVGAKEGGIGKIILGVAMIGLSFYAPGISAGFITSARIGTFGASLLLGGVSSLLSPQSKQATALEQTVANPSALFNTVTIPHEGMAIPVIYGRVRVEGIPVSQDLRVIDLSTSLPKITDPGGDPNGDYKAIALPANSGGSGSDKGTENPSGTSK